MSKLFYGILDEMSNFETFKKNIIEDSKEFLKSKGIEPVEGSTKIPPELKKEWAEFLTDKIVKKVKEKW